MHWKNFVSRESNSWPNLKIKKQKWNNRRKCTKLKFTNRYELITCFHEFCNYEYTKKIYGIFFLYFSMSYNFWKRSKHGINDQSIAWTKTKYIKLNTKTQNIFCHLNENLTTFLYTLTGATRKKGEKKNSLLKCIQKPNVIKNNLGFSI